MKLRTLAVTNLIAAAAMAPAAWAQQPYPSKPVRVIVGLAPGGGTDIQARLFSAKLSDDLKQSFVVENRPGAGELVGIQLFAIHLRTAIPSWP